MNCPACSASSFRVDGKIEGYVQGTFFTICTCDTCATSFADPHTSEIKAYDFIYKNAKHAPGYNRYYAYSEEIGKKLFPSLYLSSKEEPYYGLFRSIEKKNSKKLKILDVGSGLGYVTFALNKIGYSCEGIDLSKDAVDAANKKFGPYYSNRNFFEITIPDESEKYDVICMVELIEHVEHPLMFIEKAKELLKENGSLIVTTPNKNWYQKKIIWASDIPGVHITWFTEDGLQKMGEKFGLKTSFFDFSFYNIFHGSLLWPINETFARTPLFGSNGELLFTKYEKSKLRTTLEKIKLYEFALFIRFVFKKISELLFLITKPNSFSLYRSNTAVAIYTK